MRRGYYKHKRMMDAFIEVLSVPYAGPKYTKLKINWWVQTKYGKPYKPFPRHDRIKVLKKHLKDWERFNPRFMKNQDLSMDYNDNRQ